MTQPILYIIARTDLASMNPGKLAAQVAHGASQAAYSVSRYGNSETKRLYSIWENEAQGFGTTIVLNGGHNEYFASLSREAQIEVESMDDAHYGLIHDPTYPLRDGSFTHLIPVDTCFWVFAPKGSVEAISGLSLHK